jgi:hypothetical protein
VRDGKHPARVIKEVAGAAVSTVRPKLKAPQSHRLVVEDLERGVELRHAKQAMTAGIESNQPDVTAFLAHSLQLGGHHPHTRAVDVGHTRKVNENLRFAAINQVVDTPSKGQIAIIEHYLARQNE